MACHPCCLLIVSSILLLTGIGLVIGYNVVISKQCSQICGDTAKQNEFGQCCLGPFKCYAKSDCCGCKSLLICGIISIIVGLIGFCNLCHKHAEQKKHQKYMKELQRKRQLQKTPYAQLISSYFYHYGKYPSSELKQFIKKNYNQKYRGQVIMCNGTRYYSSIHDLVEKFEQAHNNQFKQVGLEFQQINSQQRSIRYQWTCLTPKTKINYKCIAYFDEQSKFLAVQFRQYIPYQPKQYSPPQPEKSYQNQSSAPSYYPPSYYPPSQGIDYNQQIQRSNQQFRERMNKQAQEWNDYVRAKAQRGW